MRRVCDNNPSARVRVLDEVLQPLRLGRARASACRPATTCRATCARSAAPSTTRTRRSWSAACRCGRTACCCASAPSSRDSAVDAARRLSRERRDARRGRDARDAGGSERARRAAAALRLISLPQISQVYMMFRARLLDLDFGPGTESLEVAPVRRGRHSVGTDRLPHDRAHAAPLLPRPAAGAFGLHVSALERRPAVAPDLLAAG